MLLGGHRAAAFCFLTMSTMGCCFDGLAALFAPKRRTPQASVPECGNETGKATTERAASPSFSPAIARGRDGFPGPVGTSDVSERVETCDGSVFTRAHDDGDE